jgi:hypothetical protein
VKTRPCWGSEGELLLGHACQVCTGTEWGSSRWRWERLCDQGLQKSSQWRSRQSKTSSYAVARGFTSPAGAGAPAPWRLFEAGFPT